MEQDHAVGFGDCCDQQVDRLRSAVPSQACELRLRSQSQRRSVLLEAAGTTRDSWSSVGTRLAPSAALIVTVQKAGKPTVRQVYALAAALCERMGEEFPESRGAASELIERLRVENGHPAPRLEDAPLRS